MNIFKTKNSLNKPVPELVISEPKAFQQGIHVEYDEKEKVLKGLENYDELNGLDFDDLPPSLRLNSTPKPNVEDRKKSPRKKNKNNELAISSPQGPAQHITHVDKELNWTGQDPTGHFKLLDKLGEGSYGSVYKAVAKDANIVLAIKMILIGKDQESMKKEIEILKKCNHENIVRYYGSATKENYLWIMMDFCGAGAVLDLMRKAKITLTEKEIGYILHTSLRGLAYLHKTGIIHRDIKAGNILLTEQADVKLADFGVSSQLNEKLTRSKTFVGTALWMSPEVLNQEPYDFRADIWALGITAIEMADGHPPHYEKNLMRAMVSIPMAPPPKVKQPENFSSGFIDVLSKMLTKDPTQRPDANELIKNQYLVGAGSWKDELKKRIQTVLYPEPEKVTETASSSNTIKSDTVVVKANEMTRGAMNKDKNNTQLPNAEINGAKKKPL